MFYIYIVMMTYSHSQIFSVKLKKGVYKSYVGYIYIYIYLYTMFPYTNASYNNHIHIYTYTYIYKVVSNGFDMENAYSQGLGNSTTLITILNKQIRRAMLNQEIMSITYEGVVGIIKGYKVMSEGVVIDILNTNEKIETLWNEYVNQEGLK